MKSTLYINHQCLVCDLMPFSMPIGLWKKICITSRESTAAYMMSIHPLNVAWKSMTFLVLLQLCVIFFEHKTYKRGSPLAVRRGSPCQRYHSWPSGSSIAHHHEPLREHRIQTYCWCQREGIFLRMSCCSSSKTFQRKGSPPWCWRSARRSDTPARRSWWKE